ncbi:MAG TPA: SpoIID/LytB domain-containing protein, partial [Dermatophilaceae bacterium]|nr:SpoIID/LytB domain-containing protein [Dermatophilaceae bacterium]
MFLAERFRAHRVLSLGAAGTLIASVSLVAAGPAQAVEIYPRPSDGTIAISGHGYGHGHGMSQWGAYGAAAVGKLSWQSILGFYYPGTTLGNLGNPTIRVRLDSVGSGTLNVFNTAGLLLAGTAVPGPTAGITRYRARPTATGLQVDKLSSAGWTSYKAVASPAVFSSTSGVVDVSLANGARRGYRGSIYANRATSTSITPVSVLPMESYLRAVVPAEMPASWHANALRAQAVAARSYAGYDRAHATAGRTWDTCDTTSCQMYSGVPAEYASSNAAVAATAGQTLTYGGTPAFTQFGSANGGWTAAGSQPYLPAKADPYDGAIANGANSWTASITAAAIQARWPSIGTYRQLRIISRDGHGQWGGRVLTAAIDGSNGSVTVSGTTFRSAFGLRSEWFIPSSNPANNPYGQLDSTSTGAGAVTARGWAIDPDTSSPIMVQMYIDSRANAVTWAGQPRPDVGAVFPAAGPNHGYSLTMATTPGSHTVCLYAINTGPGSSRQLGCRVVNVPGSDPFGSIDAVTTGPSRVTASGWAIDPDTSSPIMVQMYIDSRANAVTWAGQPRPDVGAVFPSA